MAPSLLLGVAVLMLSMGSFAQRPQTQIGPGEYPGGTTGMTVGSGPNVVPGFSEGGFPGQMGGGGWQGPGGNRRRGQDQGRRGPGQGQMDGGGGRRGQDQGRRGPGGQGQTEGGGGRRGQEQGRRGPGQGQTEGGGGRRGQEQGRRGPGQGQTGGGGGGRRGPDGQGQRWQGVPREGRGYNVAPADQRFPMSRGGVSTMIGTQEAPAGYGIPSTGRGGK